MRTWLTLASGITLSGAALLPDALAAQTVRVHVATHTDSTGGANVVVQLRDSAGKVVARALSDARGNAVMRAPSGGRYALRAMRIGFRPSDGESFDVADGAVIARTIVLGDAIAVLPSTLVTDSRRCAVLANSSSPGYPAWEEARKALEASLLARQRADLTLAVSVYDRQLAPKGNAVVEIDEHEEETQGARPFRAIDLARLDRDGYVVRDPSGVVFAAPDESVLLSDQFATTHCMRSVTASASSDSVVLAFTPTEDRKVGDIEGTLTLARASHELGTLRFRYTRVEQMERDAGAGGSLSFRRLPSGEWIVSAWSLRFPAVETRAEPVLAGSSTMSVRNVSGGTQMRSYITGIQETGGRVASIRDGRAPLWKAPGVPLTGVIRDSAGAPAVGASVMIRGSRTHAVTDSLGRFTIPELEPGAHLLLVTPSFADSLVSPTVRAIASTSADTNQLVARLVTRGKALATLCPGERWESAGLIRGATRDQHDSRQANVVVRAIWNNGTAALPELRGLTATSNATGDYLICGVPLRTPVTVDASNTTGSARTVVALDAKNGVALVDLRLP